MTIAKINGLQSQPSDIQNHTFSFLDSPSLARMSRVNKSYQKNLPAVIQERLLEPLLAKKYSSRFLANENQIDCFHYDFRNGQLSTGDCGDYDRQQGPVRGPMRAKVWSSLGEQIDELRHEDERTVIRSGDRTWIMDNPRAIFHYDPESQELLMPICIGDVLRSYSCVNNSKKEQMSFPNSDGRFVWIDKDDATKRVFAFYKPDRFVWIKDDATKGAFVNPTGVLKIWSREGYFPTLIKEIEFTSQMSSKKPVIYDSVKKVLYVGQHDGIRMIDAQTGEPGALFALGNGAKLMCFHVDPYSQRIFAAYEIVDNRGIKHVRMDIWYPDGHQYIFDVRNPESKRCYQVHQIDVDGDLILTSGFGAQLWSETGKLLDKLVEHNGKYYSWDKGFVWDKKRQKIVLFNPPNGNSGGDIQLLDYSDKASQRLPEEKREAKETKRRLFRRNLGS